LRLFVGADGQPEHLPQVVEPFFMQGRLHASQSLARGRLPRGLLQGLEGQYRMLRN
jgi:hypothetical protein